MNKNLILIWNIFMFDKKNMKKLITTVLILLCHIVVLYSQRPQIFTQVNTLKLNDSVDSLVLINDYNITVTAVFGDTTLNLPYYSKDNPSVELGNLLVKDIPYNLERAISYEITETHTCYQDILDIGITLFYWYNLSTGEIDKIVGIDFLEKCDIKIIRMPSFDY